MIMFCFTKVRHGFCIASHLAEFARHLGVLLSEHLAEGQRTGSSHRQEARTRHQQLLTCSTCTTEDGSNNQVNPKIIQCNSLTNAAIQRCANCFIPL